MPPAVGSRHPTHMSNPFQHLNQHHSIPQSAHYQSQSTHIPNTFNSQPQTFGTSSAALNGGISPFNPSSAYGGTAFSTGAVSSNGGAGAFNGGGGMLGGAAQGQGLASVAAQQGFARGAAMQEHTHRAEAAAALGLTSKTNAGAAGRIREVWRHNLDSEFAILRQLILKYPYVSMDAEFPGIVARPIGNFAGSKAEYHYQTLRCNVDILKPIQVGITLWSPEGELPPTQADAALLSAINGHKTPYSAQSQMMMAGGYLPCTWVFNFAFSLEHDMWAESSIELLRQTGGVDFQKHEHLGISLSAFGSLLTTSGLAFSEDVNWLSFHSGYDFGYLVKLLTDDALPVDQTDFFVLVKSFFPRLWDIKFLLRQAQRMRNHGRFSHNQQAMQIIDSLGTKSGLQDLADELQCQRIGPAHTGGSDAWLTGSVFWAMRSKIFGGELEDGLADQIYGLHGVAAPASQQYREEFFAAQGTPQQQHANGLTGGVSALQGGAQGYTPNNPSTPTSNHAGLSSQTPGPGQHYQGQGGQHTLGASSLSQGGFGNFQYGGKQ